MKTLPSPYNGDLGKPSGLLFTDTTLREGEQSPGVVFTPDEKKEIIRRLHAIGVDCFQLYPGKTQASMKLTRELAEFANGLNGIKPVVTALGFEDCWRDNIAFCLECGTGVAFCSFYTTPYVEPNWTDGSPGAISDRMRMAIDYIKSKADCPIEIVLIDATRADLDIIRRMAAIAAAAGADRITLCDTVGAAAPEAIACLTMETVAAADGAITVGVHCHNDLGLALANTLAGVRAGARTVDVSVNGLGDRAGNASLAEVSVGLRALYGVQTRIQLDQITDLSRYVARVSGRPIPVNLPLVGDLSFVDQDDFHIESQMRFPLAFKALDVRDIGGRQRIMFGKLSGPAAIALMAEKYNHPIDRDLYPRIKEALYEAAESSGKGELIDENRFWEIVEKVMSSTDRIP